MNATSGKVLQEVLMSLLITELDRKRSRIRRWCLGTKSVLGWSRFALRCHAHTVWERGGERETNKKVPIKKSTKNKKRKVCMHEQCMIMWRATKYHHGLSPIQTYQHTRFQHRNTHLKCMKHCENANVMQCMSI